MTAEMCPRCGTELMGRAVAALREHGVCGPCFRGERKRCPDCMTLHSGRGAKCGLCLALDGVAADRLALERQRARGAE